MEIKKILESFDLSRIQTLVYSKKDESDFFKKYLTNVIQINASEEQ